MNPDASSETLGEQLAQEAVAHVLTHADNYCERERERISAANEPKIIAIETELGDLKEELRLGNLWVTGGLSAEVD